MAEKSWFVCIQGASLGPLNTEAVKVMVEQKRVSPLEFAWTEGMESWERIRDIDEFAEKELPPPPSIPVPAKGEKKKASAPPPPPVASAPPTPAPTSAQSRVVKAPSAPEKSPAPKLAPAAPSSPPASTPAPAPNTLREKMKAKAAEKKAGAPTKAYVTIRRADRVDTDATLDVTGHGKFTIINMSVIGALLKAEKSVAAGTNLKFKFECKDIKKSPLAMTGVVVRDGVAQGKNELAIEFTRVNPAHKRALREYVDQKLTSQKEAA